MQFGISFMAHPVVCGYFGMTSDIAGADEELSPGCCDVKIQSVDQTNILTSRMHSIWRSICGCLPL